MENRVFIVVRIKKNKGSVRKYFAMSRNHICWTVVKKELESFIEEKLKMTKYKIVSDDDTSAYIDDHFLQYLLYTQKPALFFTVFEKDQRSSKK